MGLSYLTVHPVFKMACFFSYLYKRSEIQVHFQPHNHFTCCRPQPRRVSQHQSHVLPKWDTKRSTNNRGNTGSYERSKQPQGSWNRDQAGAQRRRGKGLFPQPQRQSRWCPLLRAHSGALLPGPAWQTLGNTLVSWLPPCLRALPVHPFINQGTDS